MLKIDINFKRDVWHLSFLNALASALQSANCIKEHSSGVIFKRVLKMHKELLFELDARRVSRGLKPFSEALAEVDEGETWN